MTSPGERPRWSEAFRLAGRAAIAFVVAAVAVVAAAAALVSAGVQRPPGWMTVTGGLAAGALAGAVWCAMTLRR